MSLGQRSVQLSSQFIHLSNQSMIRCALIDRLSFVLGQLDFGLVSPCFIVAILSRHLAQTLVRRVTGILQIRALAYESIVFQDQVRVEKLVVCICQ